MNFKILKNKNFALLLFGQATSDIGGVMFNIALSLYVLDITGSATKFATILAAGIIPKMILYPFAGVFVDRFDRKKLIVTLDTIRGIFLVIIYFLTLRSSLNIGYVYLITFTFGICETFFSPAIYTVIPFIFDSDDYEDAYACNNFIARISWLISPLLGTWLYTLFGIKVLIMIDAITFLVSAFSEKFITLKKIEKSMEKAKVFADMKEGFVALFRVKSVLLLTSALILFRVFILPFYHVVLPYFFKEILNAPNHYVGTYNTVIISGSIIGLFFVNKAKQKFGEIRVISFFTNRQVLLFIPFILLGVSPVLSFFKINPLYALIFVCILLFSIMVLSAITNVFYSTFYQRQVPIELLGRFSTTRFCLYSLGETLGLNLFGVLLDNTKLIIPMFVAVFGIFLISILISKSISLYKPIIKQDN